MKLVRRASVAVLGAVAVSLALTACGPSAANTVETKANGAGPAASQNAPAKVGDTLTLKGIDNGAKADVTVLKVVDGPNATDDVDAVPAGKRYFAVQFQIKNSGTKGYNDAPSNSAKVVDATGQTFASTTTYTDTTAGPDFPTIVDIAPGDLSTGYIVFQVPADSQITKVQFGLDSGWSDHTGQWTIA
ncbi:DUF4352 domain-containing protein [Nocardia sp. NPDC059240]|uniref:DUF4352 domain-containing protein n=1 Tax=Nocardia sp. NPDC059240 TaxID=3346786 RepID=UPI0036BDA641